MSRYGYSSSSDDDDHDHEARMRPGMQRRSRSPKSYMIVNTRMAREGAVKQSAGSVASGQSFSSATYSHVECELPQGSFSSSSYSELGGSSDIDARINTERRMQAMEAPPSTLQLYNSGLNDYPADNRLALRNHGRSRNQLELMENFKQGEYSQRSDSDALIAAGGSKTAFLAECLVRSAGKLILKMPDLASALFDKYMSRPPTIPKTINHPLAAAAAPTAAAEPTAPAPPALSQEEMVAEARRKLGMNVVDHINYAFVGQSGAGKSSLINALRNITEEDHPDAAKVGEVEATMVIKKYPHPKHPHIMFWDIPGAGTVHHPEDTYFEDKMLYAFDVILIITNARFLGLDYKIASKTFECGGTRYAFIRTKVDNDIKEKAKRNRGKCMEECSKVLAEEVRQSFEKNLKAMGGSFANAIHDLFLVSAWGFDEENQAYMHGLDRSLKKMDEDACAHFIVNSVRARFSGHK